jgi:NDP-4-keto-2,6-dideoxyhexose 3-C-methyltransferase
MYGTTYGYYSSISPMMVSHLEGISRKILDLAKPRAGDLVLDIGCNDGTLLNLLGGRGLERVGMDPSAKKFSSNFQPDLKVAFDFFSEKGAREIVGNRQFRAISSIAMFYDLDDPISFMRQIRALLVPEGIWFLELSYFPLLLTQLTYDQVCHEHVTYPGLRQMDWMLKRTGLKLLDLSFNDINGGSIFIAAGRDDGPHAPNAPLVRATLEQEAALDETAPFRRLAQRVSAHRDEVRHFLGLAKAAGKKVYGYGASTKGNIVLSHCGVKNGDLIAIGDRNPEKDGLVTPGTRIPIISHEKLRKAAPDYLFVLIWHLRREVIRDEVVFLKRGGRMVFVLPRLHVVDKDNYERYLESNFDDLAFSL